MNTSQGYPPRCTASRMAQTPEYMGTGRGTVIDDHTVPMKDRGSGKEILPVANKGQLKEQYRGFDHSSTRTDNRSTEQGVYHTGQNPSSRHCKGAQKLVNTY